MHLYVEGKQKDIQWHHIPRFPVIKIMYTRKGVCILIDNTQYRICVVSL